VNLTVGRKPEPGADEGSSRSCLVAELREWTNDRRVHDPVVLTIYRLDSFVAKLSQAGWPKGR
jgi:hypothetical protein